MAGFLTGATAHANSVDPDAWVKSELVSLERDVYRYDHFSACSMKGEDPDPAERALVRITARAPRSAISRDQFVALVQRMEAVFLMSVGESWRPGTSAMTLAAILDCRPRREPTEAASRALEIVVSPGGFEAIFTDRSTGTTSKHSETWPEAFRP